jgi:hypothetical protein
MDHHLAIKDQLPERYVFGELSDSERDNFEEHLADCSRCMEDVRTAQVFAANTFAVFRDEEQRAAAGLPGKPPPAAWWRTRWALAFSGGLNLALAGAALYAFLGVVPFLRTEVQRLEAPELSGSFVLQGPTRGARPVYTVSRDSSATFRFDVPQHFESYVCTLERLSGRLQKTYNLRGADQGETLNLTIPVAGLEPGDYDVTLHGAQDGRSQLLLEFVLRVNPAHKSGF